MKKQVYTLIAMIFLVGSMAVAAQAQTSRHAELRGIIPFQFNVGNKTLPAGEYTFRQLNPDSDSALLQIISRDSGASAIVHMITAIAKAEDTTRVVFHRYGTRYFFAEVWVDGENSGLQAPKTSAERVTERELAGINVKTETVTLAKRR